MFSFPGNAFDELVECVTSCGAMARARQAHVTRSYKEDGSVLTESDLEISSIIGAKVAQLFPDCTFVCEESPVERREGGRWTFVLDPIDGTDVYSQGLPCWAVALGILDEDRRPVGAVIDAPRFGISKEELLVTLMPGGTLHVDGKPFTPAPGKDVVEQVTMGSKGQEAVDFSAFNGKVRTLGSSIIHLIAPVVYPGMQGCVDPPCFVWDIAASHAVLLSAGMDIEHVHGGRLEYDDAFLYEKKGLDGEIYAGTPKAIEMMRRVLPIKRA